MMDWTPSRNSLGTHDGMEYIRSADCYLWRAPMDNPVDFHGNRMGQRFLCGKNSFPIFARIHSVNEALRIAVESMRPEVSPEGFMQPEE